MITYLTRLWRLNAAMAITGQGLPGTNVVLFLLLLALAGKGKVRRKLLPFYCYPMISIGLEFF